jgi:hypothetical protein
MSWILKLPESLRIAGYYAGEEAAWPAEEALSVIECLTELGAAACGVEVWIATAPSPTIPTPYVYTWEAEDKDAREAWEDYVQRVNSAAADYIRGFCWDPKDSGKHGLEPHFNLDVVCKRSQG